MPHGPFQTKYGSITICGFLTRELSPCLKEIEVLSLKLSAARFNYFQSFFRKNFSLMYYEYKLVSEKFNSLQQKWRHPELLFVELDNNEIAMVDYMNYGPAMQRHFDDGRSLLNDVEKKIDEIKKSMNNDVSTSLKIFAIIISIIIAVTQIFINKSN